MTTYADNYTPRVRGFYVAAGVPHVMKTRGTRGAEFTNSEAAEQAEAMNNYILNFETDIANDWAWTGWEWAEQDSDLWIPFLPVLSDTIAGTVNPGDYSRVAKVTAVAHSGRVAGSKARVYWYGLLSPQSLAPNEGGDGILSSAEIGGLAASTTLATLTFRGGNGQAAVFYERLTLKVNDKLLRAVRRGII